jgi:hypothetical protein
MFSITTLEIPWSVHHGTKELDEKRNLPQLVYARSCQANIYDSLRHIQIRFSKSVVREFPKLLVSTVARHQGCICNLQVSIFATYRTLG